MSDNRNELTPIQKKTAKIMSLASLFVVALSVIGDGVIRYREGMLFDFGPAGKNPIVDLTDAMAINIITGIAGAFILGRVLRRRLLVQVPATIAATALMLFGAAQIPYEALRLNRELARTTVTVKAYSLASELEKLAQTPGVDMKAEADKRAAKLLEFGKSMQSEVFTSTDWAFPNPKR